MSGLSADVSLVESITTRLRTLWQRRLVREVVVVLWFVVLALVLMGPVVTHFSEYVYGNAGDNQGTTYSLWYRRYRALSDEYFSRDALNYYPSSGERIESGSWLGELSIDMLIRPVTAYYHVILPLLEETVAYNLLVFLYLVATGLSMHWIVRCLTDHLGAAVVAGSLYVWAPSYLSQGWQNVHFFGIHWLLLYILSLIYFASQPSWLRAIVSGFLLGVAAAENPYYGFFLAQMSTLFVFVFLAYGTLTGFGSWQHLAKVIGQVVVVAGIAILVVARAYRAQLTLQLPDVADQQEDEGDVLGVVGASGVDSSLLELGGESEAHYRHSFVYYSLAAFPWDYVLPSRRHPVLGDLNRKGLSYIEGLDVYQSTSKFEGVRPDWLSNTGGVENSRQHYLGLMNLGLAIFGLWSWRRGGLSPRQDVGILFLLLVLILAPWLAGPPELPVGLILERVLQRDMPLDGLTIVAPSYWLTSIGPQIRIYARGGMMAVVSVVALSGVGLASLLRRMEGRWQSAALGIGVLAIGLFEFAAFPPYHFVDERATIARYRYIERQEGNFAIVDDYVYAQRFHEKPVLDRTWWDFIQEAEANQAEVLSGLNVRYVVMAHGDQPPFSEGLALVDSTAEVDIHEVKAEPTLVMTYGDSGIGRGIWQSDDEWVWMPEDDTFYVLSDSNATLCVQAQVEQQASFEAALLERPEIDPPETDLKDGLLTIRMQLTPGLHEVKLEAETGVGESVALQEVVFAECG